MCANAFSHATEMALQCAQRRLFASFLYYFTLRNPMKNEARFPLLAGALLAITLFSSLAVAETPYSGVPGTSITPGQFCWCSTNTVLICQSTNNPPYSFDCKENQQICKGVSQPQPGGQANCVNPTQIDAQYNSPDQLMSEEQVGSVPLSSNQNLSPAVAAGALLVALLVVAGYAVNASGKPTQYWKQRHGGHKGAKKK